MASTTITGRIVALRRLRNSVNGNPRFEIEFTGEGDATKYTPGYSPRIIRTSPDASFAYAIENREWVGGGLHQAPVPLVVLTIDGRGNATNIEHAPIGQGATDPATGSPILPVTPDNSATGRDPFKPTTRLLQVMADGHRARTGHTLTGYWTGTELRELHRTCCA